MTKALLLIPTPLECRWAGELLPTCAAAFTVEVCGFGPIVAGIRTAQLIAHHRPPSVWLLGIAGAIDPQLELGVAYEFQQVSCYGIGAGCGSNFQTAAEMGWQQWSNAVSTDKPRTVTDTLCGARLDSASSDSSRQLLTVCAASATAAEVAIHQQKFPLAQAEDMEGFAVAAACQLAQVPWRIVRGLSNVAGDRDQRNWQAVAAMRATVELVLNTIEGERR